MHNRRTCKKYDYTLKKKYQVNMYVFEQMRPEVNSYLSDSSIQDSETSLQYRTRNVALKKNTDYTLKSFSHVNFRWNSSDKSDISRYTVLH